jgi:glycosyltransferase involved in cell wall biosynthesis
VAGGKASARVNVGLVTAVYPAVMPYLADWYTSVTRQSQRRFDLCVLLDGVAPAAVAAAGGPAEARWQVVDSAAGIGAARSAGLVALVDDYDVLVLVDADDELEPERVEAAIASMAGADVGVTGMRLVDERGCDLGLEFVPPAQPDWQELIIRCNVIGLSNSAWRTAMLRRCLPAPPAAAAVDWCLATRAIAAGARIASDPAPRMRYRQHSRNVSAIVPPFTPPQLMQACDHVLAHFEGLLKDAAGLPAGWPSRLRQRRDDVKRFGERMTDAAARARYLDGVNALTPPLYWWALVAHPGLRHLW